MRTRILKVNPRRPELQKIREAARLIKRGDIVAFPTETVYGLGANALDSRAVKKIFVAKGRPADNPLIVHIYDKSDLVKLAVDVPEIMDHIYKKFWPGPLTVVLRKTKIVPKITTGGLDTVAVRMPSNLIARSLIREAGTPIAAPSANYFGRPSPTAAEHVLEDMNGRIRLVLDGGRTKIGIESTVIDLTSSIPIVLRPGGVSVEQLQKGIGRIVIHPLLRGKKSRAAYRSPGMKYKHYTPNAQVILVEGQDGKARRKIIKLVGDLKKQGKRVGVVCMSRARYNAHATKIVGPSYEKFAANLFGAFREFDLKKIDVILVQAVPKKGIGFGIMNRLEKAASMRIRAD